MEPEAPLPFSATVPPSFTYDGGAGGHEGDAYGFVNDATGESVHLFIPATDAFEDPPEYAALLAGDETPQRLAPSPPFDYVFSWSEGDAEWTLSSGVRAGRRYYVRQLTPPGSTGAASRALIQSINWLD